jgi:hypothetical protein
MWKKEKNNIQYSMLNIQILMKAAHAAALVL